MATDRNAVLREMLDAVRAIDDPEVRAQAAQDFIRSLLETVPEAAEVRGSAVRELRSRGFSHADVANLLDVSRSAAQQIARGRSRRD